RTEAPLERVRLGPASELILDAESPIEREPGLEHRAPEIYGKLETVLKLLPQAAVAEDPHARMRAADFGDQVLEACDARRSLGEAGAGGRAASPDGLYLPPKKLAAELDRRPAVELAAGQVRPIPNFALDRNPGGAFAGFVEQQLDAGRRVVLTGLPR